MSPDDPFADLIRRVRTGDPAAADELVRRYEPLVRREVRFRLEDRRLGRAFDADDVCQSVLGSFFLRAAAGQFDLAAPENLSKLLARMTRNKIASAARAQTRQKRDHRRDGGGDTALAGVAADQTSPSLAVAGQELLERLRALLTDEERRISDLRADGAEWAEVAERLGGTPQGRRMQLARAITRVSQALGLDAGPDDEVA